MTGQVEKAARPAPSGEAGAGGEGLCALQLSWFWLRPQGKLRFPVGSAALPRCFPKPITTAPAPFSKKDYTEFCSSWKGLWFSGSTLRTGTLLSI